MSTLFIVSRRIRCERFVEGGIAGRSNSLEASTRRPRSFLECLNCQTVSAEPLRRAEGKAGAERGPLATRYHWQTFIKLGNRPNRVCKAVDD
jgi:hypothetical protein